MVIHHMVTHTSMAETEHVHKLKLLSDMQRNPNVTYLNIPGTLRVDQMAQR